MNSLWLTTLKSKTDEVKKRIEDELGQRGIKLTPQDLAALIEEVSPELSQKLLSNYFNLLRPFSKGLGLRISVLDNDHIELWVPESSRNLDELGQIHIGAITTATVEAVKILWERHLSLDCHKINVQKIELKKVNPIKGDLRLKYQLLEKEREALLAELRLQRRSFQQSQVQVFNESEQIVYEVQLNLEFEYTPQLS